MRTGWVVPYHESEKEEVCPTSRRLVEAAPPACGRGSTRGRGRGIGGEGLTVRPMTGAIRSRRQALPNVAEAEADCNRGAHAAALQRLNRALPAGLDVEDAHLRARVSVRDASVRVSATPSIP